MDLSTPIQFVRGVGPRRAEVFAQLGIHTAGDLLQHFPRDYIDRSRIRAIARLQPGETATVVARVRAVRTMRGRRGRADVHARVADASGELACVWFNQPFREKQLPVGSILLFSGEVRVFRGVQMANPEFEPLDDDERQRLHTGRIVPVYPLSEGLSQSVVRQAVMDVLGQIGEAIPDVVPAAALAEHGLAGRAEALRGIHYPDTFEQRDRARERLAFEELFLLQLTLLTRRRAEAGGVPGIAMRSDGPLVRQLRAALPWPLTGAQTRVCREIAADMARPAQMHRLLQGDVGSGKTVVAAFAAMAAIDSGHQVALMAPTEILAEQHCRSLQALCAGLPVRIALLSGRIKGAARREVLTGIASGTIQFICGTHALIQEAVRFDRLGLLIIDEQHRFGVRHRVALRAKAEAPDSLVMSATPIPRTLAMAFYGDLDVSTIDELPPGRGEVSTHLVTPGQREKVYGFVADRVAKGHQAYIVYPAIDESDALAVRAATRGAETLHADARFADYRVGLVHGRQKPAERDEVMQAFRAGTVQVLVATTVIEVGVDVPNASIMVVENPERFGLAQLHQLRGRIGRGTARSYFVLLPDDALSMAARDRLEALVRTRDGFAIADEDLKRRGPGDILGTRQHGLPELRAADLSRDGALLRAARRDAQSLMERDPDLASEPALRAWITTRTAEASALLAAG